MMLRHWLLFTAVLLIAAVLRMGWPGISEFKADEARLYSLALNMANGDFALRGISSSVGFPNFPMSVWLYALPLLLWASPLAATLFTGLLNTAAVGGVYWLVQRYWGRQAALAAALLAAVSPWAVIFSRKIWAQNLLPLFVVLWAGGALLAFVEKRPSFLILHLLALAMAAQIHLAAVALLPVTLVLLVVFRRDVAWRVVLVGAALGLATALPFLIYLWQNRRSYSLPGGSGTSLAFSFNALRHAAILNLGLDIHSLAGPAEFEAYLARLPGGGAAVTAVGLLWGLLMLLGLGWLLTDLRRRWPTPAARAGLLVVLWLVVPVLVFIPTWTDNFIHYFIATLPAAAIVGGVALARLAQRRPAWTLPLWGGLGLTAVFQVTAVAILLNFVSQRATPAGFGTPLAYQLAAAEAAQAALANSDAAEIVVAGPGESPRTEHFPAVWDALLAAVPHRFVDGRRHALFPADGAVVILSETTPQTALLYAETAVARQTISLRAGEGAMTIYTLPPQAAPPPQIAIEPPQLLANWVNLRGYSPLTAVAGDLSWQLHWRPGDNPDPAQYQVFAHLLNSEGERIAQVDTPAFSPAQWRAGDVVVSQFVFSEMAGTAPPLAVRSGMYRYPSLAAVPLLDVAGNPAGDALEITPPLQAHP